MSKEYSSELILEKAKEFNKKALDLEDDLAIHEFKKSNHLLEFLLRNFSDVSKIDFSSFNSDEISQAKTSELVAEIYRILSINHNKILDIYAGLIDYETVRREMNLAVEYGKKCVEIKKSLQNYNTYISSLISSIFYSRVIEDNQIERQYFFEYLSILPEAIRNGLEVSSNYRNVLDEYLSLIKKEPKRGKEALKMIKEFSDSLEFLDNLFVLGIWGEFAFNLLQDYLENQPDWNYPKESVVSILLEFLLNCAHIAKVKDEVYSATFLVPFLEKLQEMFSEKDKLRFLLKIYNELIEAATQRNEFKLEADLLEKVTEVVKKNSEIFSEITLIELYQKLIAAYAEVDRFKEAHNLGNTVKNLIDSLQWNELLEEELNISETELASEINFQKFQLYFNIGLNEYYQKNIEQAKENLDKAWKYLNLIEEFYYKKKSLENLEEYFRSVNSIVKSSSKYLNLKGENKLIWQIVQKLDNILSDVFVFNKNISSQEEKQYGREAALLLRKIIRIPIASSVIKPDQLLNYYYLTLQILDHKEDLRLTTEILESAIELNDNNYLEKSMWMVWILYDAANYLPDMSFPCLLKAVKRIEKYGFGLTGKYDVFVADVYFLFAKDCLKSKRYYFAKLYAHKAERIYEDAYYSGRTYLIDELQAAREIIKKATKLKNN